MSIRRLCSLTQLMIRDPMSNNGSQKDKGHDDSKPIFEILERFPILDLAL
jgi:hypothetical protein